MTEEELIEIKRRLNLATKGPWKSYIEGRDIESGSSFVMTGIKDGEDIFSNHRGEDIYLNGATNDDQDFIANARQDIPRLIQEVEKLKQEIERLNIENKKL